VSRLGETEQDITDESRGSTDPSIIFPPGTAAPESDESTDPDAPKPRRRGRLAVRLLGSAWCLGLLLAAGGVGAFFWVQHRLDSNIERIGNPFGTLPEAERRSVVDRRDEHPAARFRTAGSPSTLAPGSAARSAPTRS
jgi:hypothetical protein